jgi:hypothetical protein
MLRLATRDGGERRPEGLDHEDSTWRLSMTTHIHSERTPFRIPWWLGLALLTGIALFFLWEEHQAHVLGALPWLLFLACPLIHVFMHRGHGHGSGDATDPAAGHSQHRGDGT